MRCFMTSKYFFSLDSIKPQINNSGGSLIHVTSNETPGFVNISFASLKLNPRGSTEPIWHTNANKIGYCTEGEVLVQMRSPDQAEEFTVQAGEIFFIPQGYIHRVENISQKNSVIQFALNHTHPETMRISKAIGSLADSVFNSTFNTSSNFVDSLKKTQNNELIKVLSQSSHPQTNGKNEYKFDIKDSNKPILTKGGYLQIGTKSTLPKLEGLGILGFGLNPKGIVEPHWHTNAGELVFIVKGKTRITVLSPDGQLNVMEVNGGQGAFAPASHFHNIENVGSENVEVIAFFSHATPDYIGIGEVIGSYSNEVLGSIFNVSPSYFDAFKKEEEPLVIVPI